MAGAAIQVAGPCWMYVDGSFLGTAERSPKLQFVAEWEPVMNAIAGTKIPLDELFQNMHAWCRASLTRWDLSVYKSLVLNRGPQAGLGTVYGAVSVVLELYFPYTKNGYRFPTANAYGPDDHDELNTAARKLDVVFHCLPSVTPSSVFSLFSELSAPPAQPS